MRSTLRLFVYTSLLAGGVAYAQSPARPNILWLTSEDNGPHLGCYGDDYADTPHLDRLAARGIHYLNAWSNAPVCAPARTTIITGVYPPCLGAQHMRSMVQLPPQIRMFPQLLREAGYYCTNRHKEDYNVEKPGQVWDVSNPRGHWRSRKPGQPFFAVFNFGVSHESQVRKRPHKPIHDPAKVRLAAYHPDAPEIRQDWAQYHDKITEMDAQAGAILAQLEEDGLVDDTIVFYYADHGPGMPRSKRWPYNSGLRVPMIVSVPDRFAQLAPDGYARGAASDRLVAFIDLAPTVLSLAGIEPPDYMQGHAFMGKYRTPEPPYAYGFRGRMDERYDMVRSVRDKRYIYIRNYMPHLIYGKHVAYMFQTPTTRVWKALYDQGKLEPPMTFFWEPKPADELYDLTRDPDEVHNLAASPDYRDVVTRLRRAQQDLAVEIRDLGFLPEDEIHTRSRGSTPWQMGHDNALYPMARIMAAAELVSSPDPPDLDTIEPLLRDGDSAVRFWGAMGVLMRGADAVTRTAPTLRAMLADPSPSVRIVAANALGKYGNHDDVTASVDVLVDLARLGDNSIYVVMFALNALDDLGDKAKPALARIRALPREHASVPQRMRFNVPKLLDKILADLGDLQK